MELHDTSHLVGYSPLQAMAEPKSEYDPAQSHVQLGQYSPTPSMDTRRPLPKFEAQGRHGNGSNMTPSSDAPGGLTHQQAAQRREQLKAKRRVPASQRKRTKLSCDYCKTRRCKCQRLDQTSSSSSMTER
ncbi:hypothetical protein PG985_005609 [Apiospora marii]|uniref:uncharacterized protein n=1 Tax=Apiospora marii TaxID=335849 RepID=UPI00313106C5